MSIVILYNILCSTVVIQQGSISPSYLYLWGRSILVPSMYPLVNVFFISVFPIQNVEWKSQHTSLYLSHYCQSSSINSFKWQYRVTCKKKSHEMCFQMVFQKCHIHLCPQKQLVKDDITLINRIICQFLNLRPTNRRLTYLSQKTS